MQITLHLLGAVPTSNYVLTKPTKRIELLPPDYETGVLTIGTRLAETPGGKSQAQAGRYYDPDFRSVDRINHLTEP